MIKCRYAIGGERIENERNLLDFHFMRKNTPRDTARLLMRRIEAAGNRIRWRKLRGRYVATITGNGRRECLMADTPTMIVKAVMAETWAYA